MKLRSRSSDMREFGRYSLRPIYSQNIYGLGNTLAEKGT